MTEETTNALDSNNPVPQSFVKPNGIELVNGVSIYQGQDARTKLELLLDFEEDSTGTVWVLETSLGPWQQLEFQHRPADVDQVQAVMIDSGNKHGDAWKYTYYPINKFGVFCLETLAPFD